MKKSEKHPPFPCEFCHKHIPHSAVFTPEGMDYALHFCGHACFTKWKKNKPEEKKK